MKFEKILPLAFFLCSFFSLKSQTDTLPRHDHERDSFYWIVENRLEKNKFWGNAWYAATAYNLSSVNEFNFNVGRSYVRETYSGGGPYVVTMNTWGLGYGTTWKNGQTKNLAHGFAEHSLFLFPPISWTLRGEYFYDFTDRQHYLRPSVGLNLFILDILYNYSFKLNGTENDFKHGVTFRLKYYFNNNKWETHRPNRC